MSDDANHAHGFTEQQFRAITTRDVSVSLSAGAGCGKTFVLTERYLAHFDLREPGALRPDQIGQLVAITFTDRAAREMRGRIRRRCYERLAAAEADQATYWADLLRALDTARISTIHAFCTTLLRSRAVEAGLDPQFGVLEQAQAETLLSEALDDEIRRLVSGRDETTIELAVRYNLDGLRKHVREFVLAATPERFARWRDVTPDELVAAWEEYLKSSQRTLAAEFAATLPATKVRAVLEKNVPSHRVMAERRRIVLDALARLANFNEGDSLVTLLVAIAENAKVQGGGLAKAWPDAEAYETFKKAAEELRNDAKKLASQLAFDRVSARPVAQLGLELLVVADGVRRVYDRRKAELRMLDFNDLLVRARALLVGDGEAVARQLGEQITLLLVDEFQDTDPLQVDLVKALCGEKFTSGKLFFVGDFKQSIYRFRGADPGVFHRLRAETPERGRQTLSLNFRSQGAILNFVNALFWDDLGGDAYEALRPKRAQITPEPAIEFLWAPLQATGRPSAEALQAIEADWIARRIRELLDSGEPIVWDESSGKEQPQARGARQGDIAILLRALTGVEAYESALQKYGIDYYLVGGHAFYAQQEIFDLLNLLRALDSPTDVVSLVGALRSPFFSLADETIYWLGQAQGGIAGGLFATRHDLPLAEDEGAKVEFAARTLKELRAYKDRLRISELIERILNTTGYDAVLVNEFLGERKLANLQKLVEQARTFQRGDFLGLTDYIAQLSEFVSRQPDEPLAATHSEDTDVVRLMSVHQSKGLEFPIVVVPGMNRLPQSGVSPVCFHEQLGPLVRPDKSGGSAIPSSGHAIWSCIEQFEEEAERKRLLYVATTRAADYLILAAGVNNVGDASSPWMQLLGRRFDLANGTFLGELREGQAPPRVRVTTEQPPAERRGSRTRRLKIDELVAAGWNAPGCRDSVRRAVDPVAVDPAARAQYSFSRLSGRLHRKFERLDDGAFDGEGSPDPRGLGTLVHAVLAVLDFKQPQGVRELVERFAEQLLSEPAGDIDEAVELIERFIGSPRAQELACAAVSHAEVEFLLAWPPEELAFGRVALRGYLDRLYQDSAGDWHVLDFKTNRVGAAGVAKQAADYEMQMLVYGLATERILKASPKGLVLHFLRTGEEHAFEWNAAARRRVTELVDRGIAVAQSGA